MKESIKSFWNETKSIIYPTALMFMFQYCCASFLPEVIDHPGPSIAVMAVPIMIACFCYRQSKSNGY